MIFTDGYYMNYIGEVRPSGVESTATKIEYLASKYKTEANKIYYSVIPSKSYFINDRLKTPFDYNKMLEILDSNINTAEYIDIFDTLTLSDYYVTDPHFKQDKLQNVVTVLGAKLGFAINIAANKTVTVENFTGQHGYNKQDFPTEELVYLTNQYIDNAYVTSVMGDSYDKVYNLDKLNSSAPYDMFLSGPSPITTIKNNSAPEDKKLVIFRDSYSCSLAPLFIENYNEIILVDLRYIASSLIENYVDIKNKDILFLYNDQVVNNGEMLKVIFNWIKN